VPTVLITGASTGIGRATVLHLARAGWTVFAGVRKIADGEALAAAGGVRVEPIVLDVTDPAQVAGAVERVNEHGGRLDALVNNAGIGYGGPLELIPIGDLRHQLEVNVLGPVALTQALLPALRRARGRVVLVSSIGGRVPMAFTAPYAASKHALEAIGDALRVELRSSHVQVALIEPGSVATPIWDKSRAQGEHVTVPPELAEQYGHVEVAMRKVIDATERRGVPPEQVAKTIEQALTARRMRARYVIGRDARAMLLAKRLLPDHVFDRVARRALGV
jgi:NAD(P)-dependent dehydrogenase (short-subunit alcohol dehydrogenase family)